MKKIESLAKINYETNLIFIQEKLDSYLKEIYEINKIKFELRLKNNEIINDTEYKIMILLKEKFDFISIKIKNILYKKPLINTVNFRKNKEINTLIESLTS